MIIFKIYFKSKEKNEIFMQEFDSTQYYVGKEIYPMLRQFNVFNYNIDEKNEKFQTEYATAKNQIS